MCWTPLYAKKHKSHGTQNIKTQKTKKMSNMHPTNKPGVNSGAREW